MSTGYSSDPASGGGMKAFLYTDPGGMVPLGSLGGTQTIPHDINDNGAIVGDATLPGSSLHAFLHTRAAGVVDLNSLIDSTSG